MLDSKPSCSGLGTVSKKFDCIDQMADGYLRNDDDLSLLSDPVEFKKILDSLKQASLYRNTPDTLVGVARTETTLYVMSTVEESGEGANEVLEIHVLRDSMSVIVLRLPFSDVKQAISFLGLTQISG